MPHVTELLKPDLFLEHAGVKVFHAYRLDDYSELRYRYAVQLKRDCGIADEDVQEIDVRFIGDGDHIEMIKSAIDDGGRDRLIQLGRDDLGVASELAE